MAVESTVKVCGLEGHSLPLGAFPASGRPFQVSVLYPQEVSKMRQKCSITIRTLALCPRIPARPITGLAGTHPARTPEREIALNFVDRNRL